MSQISRKTEHIVQGQPTRDGAGVNLIRVLTQQWQRRLDPFLMLDEFRSDDPNDYIAVFRNIRTAALRPSPICWRPNAS